MVAAVPRLRLSARLSNPGFLLSIIVCRLADSVGGAACCFGGCSASAAASCARSGSYCDTPDIDICNVACRGIWCDDAVPSPTGTPQPPAGLPPLACPGGSPFAAPPYSRYTPSQLAKEWSDGESLTGSCGDTSSCGSDWLEKYIEYAGTKIGLFVGFWLLCLCCLCLESCCACCTERPGGGARGQYDVLQPPPDAESDAPDGPADPDPGPAAAPGGALCDPHTAASMHDSSLWAPCSGGAVDASNHDYLEPTPLAESSLAGGTDLEPDITDPDYDPPAPSKSHEQSDLAVPHGTAAIAAEKAPADHGWCCPWTWRRPWKQPDQDHTEWWALLVVVSSIGLISATGLAIDRIAALDHSLDQLATDLNVVSTWVDEFHVATDNVTNHTLATQAAFDAALLTIPGGIQGISNTTVLAMIKSINSTLDVVRHANRETGSLATEIRGSMQDVTDSMQRGIDQFNAVWYHLMLTLVGIATFMICGNLLTLCLHGYRTGCTHGDGRGYRCWRKVYTPVAILVILLFFVVSSVYYAVGVVASSVCIAPTSVVLDLLAGNTANQQSHIQLAAPVSYFEGDQPTAEGTTFLVDCDGISGIHGPCFTADTVYTPARFVSYYFGCGDECMEMPFKVTETFIKTELLNSVVTAVNAISIGEWSNTSIQFDLTLDALTGGPIVQPTGSQPYGLFGMVSCPALNSRFSKLLMQTCHTVFPEVASIYNHFVAAGVLLAVIEYATRRLWWATDLPPNRHRLALRPAKQGARDGVTNPNPAFESQGPPSWASAGVYEDPTTRAAEGVPSMHGTKPGDGLTERLLP